MSLFNIGLSGLNTAQNALNTVGHNLSNSATPGYTRQNTIIASAGGLYSSQGFIGQGSNAVTVQRVYDAFLTGQLRGAQTSSAQLSTYSTQIAQIDNLLADQTSGLAPLMQKFFSAVQGVADTPADPSARQNLLSAAQALVGQVRSSDQYFKQLQSGVNTQLQSSVTEVNAYTKQIANLNTEIAKATAASGGQPPNDLLDQRDQAVSELTKLIGAKVVVQDGGTYNVVVGNGQPLVIGGNSYDLQAVPSSADPSRTVLAYTLPTGGAIEMADSSVSGGSIGGLVQFRSETLDGAQNAIGRISLALGQTFNDQHKLGIDLNGQVGGDLFQVGQATVLPNTRNTGTAQVTASITSTSSLTTSDYTLKFDGTNYSLVRASDNKTVASAAVGTYPMQLDSGDGFSLQITAGMQPGDSFLVQPTRNAASAFNVLIQDPAKIAAAAPTRVSAGAGNSGTGTVTLGNVASNFTMLGSTITATYNGAGYTFTDAAGKTVTPSGSSTSGTAFSYTINGQTVTFDGAPKAGDTFTLAPNTGGVSDNSNALQLAKLQNAKTIGGVSSFNDAYAQLVNDVGSRAKSVKIASTSQDSITSQVQAAQQSVSGVNTDEETVSMLRYQQLYQANAQVIQTASTLFDTIIGIGR